MNITGTKELEKQTFRAPDSTILARVSYREFPETGKVGFCLTHNGIDHVATMPNLADAKLEARRLLGLPNTTTPKPAKIPAQKPPAILPMPAHTLADPAPMPPLKFEYVKITV